MPDKSNLMPQGQYGKPFHLICHSSIDGQFCPSREAKPLTINGLKPIFQARQLAICKIIAIPDASLENPVTTQGSWYCSNLHYPCNRGLHGSILTLQQFLVEGFVVYINDMDILFCTIRPLFPPTKALL